MRTLHRPSSLRPCARLGRIGESYGFGRRLQMLETRLDEWKERRSAQLSTLWSEGSSRRRVVGKLGAQAYLMQET